MKKEKLKYWTIPIPSMILWLILILVDWEKKDKTKIVIFNAILYAIVVTISSFIKAKLRLKPL